MFLFKPKKQEEPKAQVVSKANADLEIITRMNQEFASSLDLNETLNTALEVIIESCLLYTSPSPRDDELSRMPSSA